MKLCFSNVLQWEVTIYLHFEMDWMVINLVQQRFVLNKQNVWLIN